MQIKKPALKVEPAVLPGMEEKAKTKRKASLGAPGVYGRKTSSASASKRPLSRQASSNAITYDRLFGKDAGGGGGGGKGASPSGDKAKSQAEALAAAAAASRRGPSSPSSKRLEIERELHALADQTPTRSVEHCAYVMGRPPPFEVAARPLLRYVTETIDIPAYENIHVAFAHFLLRPVTQAGQAYRSPISPVFGRKRPNTDACPSREVRGIESVERYV